MRNPSPDAVRRAARAVLAVAPGAVMPDEIGMQEQRTLMLPAMEQTKGALMVIYGLTEEAAMALLRWYARQWNVSAQNIATALTNVAEPETMGEEAERRLDDLLTALSRDLPSAPPRAQADTEQRPSKAPATLRTRVAGISEARDVPFCAAHLFEANAAERARRSTLGNQLLARFHRRTAGSVVPGMGWGRCTRRDHRRELSGSALGLRERFFLAHDRLSDRGGGRAQLQIPPRPSHRPGKDRNTSRRNG